ncbi:MAG: aminotransferase class I/II-fold pyridoxal phosphate-dependent enzyme [Clostridia bacterium]|nr:aminotransferase class I/II-fold pyridoxal phosphate-dependent enzyme [Clostridia bacterium]
MSLITEMTPAALRERQEALQQAYDAYKAQNLKLDMSRGKPGAEQLGLTAELTAAVDFAADYKAEDGTDTRNYGVLCGLPETRRLFGEIFGVSPDRVIVGGNASLTLMYDYLATAYMRGVCGGKPWAQQGAIKFLCPVPGYDRHFAITEFLGIEMINVPLTDEGPDMAMVEELVKDPLVKGMWCVPMYANPTGITYSDETVRRLAALRPAAADFRIMWDNAYCLHHFRDTHDKLLNIYAEAEKVGNEDIVLMFTSTSKISFPGAGVGALAASDANLADIKKRMTVQTIGHDKMNMLRHSRYFRDLAGVEAHMEKHAAFLRPRFDVVAKALSNNLAGKGIARWTDPNGGYFISVDLLPGTAKETVRLLKEAGVVLTGAGATFPYGRDPQDANLRIAPSYPPVEELTVAMELFCICAELAAVNKLLTA